MTTEPCTDWTTADAAADCCTLTAEQIEPWVPVASSWLWRLTGTQFGGPCTVTVRPVGGCLDPRRPLSSVVPSHGMGDLTQWRIVRSGCCGGYRSGAVDLGLFPLHSVSSVVVDGDAVALSNLRIDDNRILVRHDGRSWPCCQNLSLPAGQVGTWTVTASVGFAPPDDAELVAGILACELAKGCVGDETSRLPRRVQSITRLGVTQVIMDPFQFLEQGKLGLFEIDAFIMAHNPGRLISPPVVGMIDQPARNHVTTWSGA